MREKFFKYLKRFFILLPLIMMILQIVFSMGSYWRDNGTLNWEIGDDDFIQRFVLSGNWNANAISNPLLIEPDSQSGIYNYIQTGFVRMYTILTGTNYNNMINDFANIPEAYAYPIIIVNFFTWWIFVELFFLFFRFITFLISWVNSLFDRCFNKINKG